MARRNFFKLTSSLLHVEKKLFWRPIIWTQIFNCGPNAPDASYFLSLDIEKSVSETCEELWPLHQPLLRPTLLKPLLRPTKIVFLWNSWSCLQDFRGAGCHKKLQLNGATDFLSKIWQNITKFSFVSALIFVFLPESPTPPPGTCMLEKDIIVPPIRSTKR